MHRANIGVLAALALLSPGPSVSDHQIGLGTRRTARGTVERREALPAKEKSASLKRMLKKHRSRV